MIASSTDHYTNIAGRTAPASCAGRRVTVPTVVGVDAHRSGDPGNYSAQNAEELQRRARRIFALRIDFVPKSLLRESAANQLVDKFEPYMAENPAVETCRRESESAVVRTLCRAPLLSPDLERSLFLRMNLAKAAACQYRERLSRNHPDREELERIEQLLAEAVNMRNRIVESNLRLVVSIAKWFEPAGDAWDEAVCEGILPLIRAVELFDFTRGTRFSTYTTHAIRNHLLRVRKRRARRAATHAVGGGDLSDAVPDPRPPQQLADTEVSHRLLAEQLLARLDRRERSILAARFGLHEFDRQHTFLEIGRMVRLSKERTRILAHRAIEKLQASVVPA